MVSIFDNSILCSIKNYYRIKLLVQKLDDRTNFSINNPHFYLNCIRYIIKEYKAKKSIN